MTEQVQMWPRISAVVNDDATAIITINGNEEKITADDVDAARDEVRARITATAQKLKRPVRATTVDPDGKWTIIVTPDGQVRPDDDPKPKKSDRPHAAAQVSTDATVTDAEPRQEEASTMPDRAPSTAAASPDGEHPVGKAIADSDPLPPPPAPPGPPAGGQQARRTRSFLAAPDLEEPATLGFRGFLTKVGLRTAPSDEERAYRADITAVSRHWPGTKTIAVVNGKGGANKTPTAILLASVFARFGGQGVLAWDNNDTRGTLGWRTEAGPHESTVVDLLPHADDLMVGTSARMDAFVHHQTGDKFAVLRSNPELLASEQRLTAGHFDTIHRLMSKYFRILIIDSGNDESTEPWLRMIDKADQLVLATTTRADHAEAGRLLLVALAERDAHGEHLADNAVVAISHADQKEPPADQIAGKYEGMARAVTTIPYDEAMRATHLRYNALQKPTQRAYLRTAAEAAAGL